MTLADARLKQLDTPSLTTDERALLRCRVAADLIHKGQYEAARDALGELWRGVGERPNVEGLDERTAAEVLLQAGALSGWLGATRQAAGSQEAAKDLISESAALFEKLGEMARAAFARSDLALCYWREGAYDEARVLVMAAFEGVTETVERAIVLLRLTTIEFSASRYSDAFALLKEHAYIFDEQVSHVLRGSFHSLLGLVLKQLGSVEGRPDYLDRAIIEFTAAIHHYEQAQHERYRAYSENNLANLLRKLGHYREAHEHLDRARSVLARGGDTGLLAQVDETRARVLIAEQRYREANRVIDGAIQTLERGGESALLAEALTVHGVVWARLEVYEGSINVLRRAVEVAEASGALYSAGRAALTLIEEHGATRLSQMEAYRLYCRADELLKNTQDAEEVARLRACARVVLRRLTGACLHDEGFTLHGTLYEFEAKYIEQALEEAGGSVTKAARLLGIPYQSLAILLNTRHRQLRKLRTPAKSRKRALFRAERDAK